MQRILLTISALAALTIAACTSDGTNFVGGGNYEDSSMSFEIEKTADEWREELTAEEYRVLREKGTEPAYTGEYWDTKTPGIYVCAACANELFSSETKFSSGTGWPSFYAPVSDSAVKITTDYSHNMVRQEVVCARCGGHLGHVFKDGPPPTHLRYCLNSISLDLIPGESASE